MRRTIPRVYISVREKCLKYATVYVENLMFTYNLFGRDKARHGGVCLLGQGYDSPSCLFPKHFVTCVALSRQKHLTIL